MSRATERLSELKNKGLITQEQYDELLAALSTVENELPQVPQAPRLPAEPAVPTAPIRPVTPVSAPQAVGHLSVRLISEDLHVRGVQGLPAVRVVGGQSGIRTRQNGDVVEIESRLTAGEFHGFSFSLGFGSDGQPVELEVPADMACELKTVSGDITLSNLKGETVVRSVSGDIDASALTHLTSAQSTSPDVDCAEVRCVSALASMSPDTLRTTVSPLRLLRVMSPDTVLSSHAMSAGTSSSTGCPSLPNPRLNEKPWNSPAVSLDSISTTSPF